MAGQAGAQSYPRRFGVSTRALAAAYNTRSSRRGDRCSFVRDKTGDILSRGLRDTGSPTMQDRKKLYKSTNDGMIFGVAGELADYFEIDPVLMRLILLALAFVSAGTMVIVYIIAAIIMPTAAT